MFFDYHNCRGIKFVTRLRLGLCHLRENKLKHSFWYTLNPFCFLLSWCGNKCEFFICCSLFSNQRCTLSTVNDIARSLVNTNYSNLTHPFFLVKAPLDIPVNTHATINFIISTNRFEESLFFSVCNFSYTPATLFQIWMSF